MKQLWKSLVQCHIDYCSQLYMPGTTQGMQDIEKLFYNFLARVPEVREDNYWTRLTKSKVYSQERRMERYRILYVWKILEGLAPNCGVQLATEIEWLGRKCQIPGLKKKGRAAIQTLREYSFQINGPRLFKCLPKKLRNMKIYQDEFKEELDRYLSTIPDEPRIASLVPTAVCRVTAKQSNSLLAWIRES